MKQTREKLWRQWRGGAFSFHIGFIDAKVLEPGIGPCFVEPCLLL